MAYPDQFKAYREARGLSREQLAARADCHRNTVINVETGRPVKFATVLLLMEKMDYARDGAEVKTLALLWLESVTGLQISLAESHALHADANGTRQLQAEVVRRRLGRADVDLLTFAARHRKVLGALRAIRELVPESVRASAKG